MLRQRPQNPYNFGMAYMNLVFKNLLGYKFKFKPPP